MKHPILLINKVVIFDVNKQIKDNGKDNLRR